MKKMRELIESILKDGMAVWLTICFTNPRWVLDSFKDADIGAPLKSAKSTEYKPPVLSVLFTAHMINL